MRGKWFLVGTALGALALVSSACYIGTPGGPTVGIVGDSITHLLEPYLDAITPVAYRIDVNGRSGATIADQLGTIDLMERTDVPPPQDWILNLGTNDALYGARGIATNWQAAFQVMMALVATARCVILVTVHTVIDTTSSHVAADLNRLMWSAHAADPSRVLVLNWDGLAAEHPDWLEVDAVHPNAAGLQGLTNWYNLALSVCPA